MGNNSFYRPIFLLTAIHLILCSPVASLGAPKPSAPTGLGAALAYPQVLLTWRANPEPGITGYNVYRSLSAKTGYGKLNASPVTAPLYQDSPPTLNKTYYYKVTARNSTGEGSASTPASIAYHDNAPPVISGVGPGLITGTSAAISWQTDEPATSQVDYGTSTAYGQTTTVNSLLVTAHTAALAGLMDDTLYHYRVRSTDAKNNTAVSGDFTFATSDLTPPAGVTSFAVTPGENKNVLAWTNPAAADFGGTMIRFSTSDYPASPSDGLLVCSRGAAPGSGDSFTHAGLANGTTYYYTAFAYDEVPNFGPGSEVSGTPHLVVISLLGTSGLWPDRALIDWTTDVTATTQVEYWECPAGDRQTAAAAGYVTDHAVTVTGLSSGTLYCYQAISTDESGASFPSDVHTFRTVGTDVAECLACHDGSDTSTPAAGAFSVEGHGKGDLNLVCSDCHEDHRVNPTGYKYLKGVNGFSFPSPYPLWQEAMYAQRDYCLLACHTTQPVSGVHPVADDPVSIEILQGNVHPYVRICSDYSVMPEGVDIKLLDADQNHLNSCDDIVMCDSCHNPHGRAGSEHLQRDGDRFDTVGLCMRCHIF